MKKVLLLLLTFAVIFTMAGAVSAVEITGDASVDQTGEMTAELPIAESYVVSFPEKVTPAITVNGYSDISEPVVISVSNAIIDTKKGLFITLESANEFTIKSGDKSSVQYVVGIEGENNVYTNLSNGDYIQKVFAGEAVENAKITNLKFYTTKEWMSKARVGGSHTDTLTFTCSIEDVVSQTDDFGSAVTDALSEAAASGEPATVYLGAGEYIIPSTAQGKTLTIVGTEDTEIKVHKVGTGGENCDYGFDGSTVTLKGVTITTDSSTYRGWARANLDCVDCTFDGTLTLYGDSKFTNCEFNIEDDLYNIWTWGAPTATFDGCTFNSDGKALLLYGTANTKLTVKNCVFNDNGGLTDLKAAIEIGNDYGKSYELIVANTVVNGYEINDKGINTGTTLWGNKNSMGQDRLNVVVDGVDVY